jgi:uncharacterized repeat protein (TIGR02543 family)
LVGIHLKEINASGNSSWEKVQFNANGWRFTDSQSSKREYTFSGTYKTLDSLEAIRVSGLPTKNDVMKSWYEFVGWFTTLSSVGWEQVWLSTVVSSKKTYYARWAKNAVEYQVILDTDGWKFKETNSSSMKFNFRGFNQKLESNSSLIGILVKSDATPEAVLEKSGYKFLGWYTKKSSGWEKINNDLTVNSKTTYYARWNKEAPKYSVIFDYNGWEADSDHKKYKEILVSGVNTRIWTLPTGFSRKWYTLVSTNTWNTKQNGKWSAVTEDATVRARSIFYAQWNKVEWEYPITFHANGWYFDGRQSSVTYSSVNQKITFPETKGINWPIKNGFTRKGTWFTSTGVQVYESTATVPTTVKSPTTYYAHWDKNPDTYDITFDAGLWTFD